ncbi:SPW repeat protein [Microvirga massiliensis]|uniref:SPW repeat protein n=1 Tax=Microvirga massiliensis TaxID=1033741 RepID=UPI00062BC538|nr:SPW repeat protein [Microvirga massiliensis]
MKALWEREDAAINGLNAALGVILLISPSLLNFSVAPIATGTAVTGGIIIAMVAFAAFMRLLEWEEWVNLTTGLCVMFAPWLFEFAGMNSAAWTHTIIGLTVSALASVELWRLHGPPPPRVI